MEQNGNLKQTAYEYIKRKILNCEYFPGQDISEKQIVESLETGRTPVREALLALQKEGLVDIFPRKGTGVKAITISDTIELYQLRRLIEPAVVVNFKHMIDPARLMEFETQFRENSEKTGRENDIAFFQLDVDFHRFIVDSIGNSRLSGIFQETMQAAYRVGVFKATIGNSVTKEQTYIEHKAIIQAILMEDDDAIEASLVAHINSSRLSSLRILEEVQKKFPQYTE